MPPVTFSPRIILSFTGFQILDPAGALKSGPYFQVASVIGPWLMPPGSALLNAPLSLPAGAASGKFILPAAGLYM